MLTMNIRFLTSYECFQLAQSWQSDMLRITFTILRYTPGSADSSTLSYRMFNHRRRPYVCKYYLHRLCTILADGLS